MSNLLDEGAGESKGNSVRRQAMLLTLHEHESRAQQELVPPSNHGTQNRDDAVPPLANSRVPQAALSTSGARGIPSLLARPGLASCGRVAAGPPCDIFVLVFLLVNTRRVYLSPSTYKPDEAWMLEQADAFHRFTQERRLPCKMVMHDNDGKFSKPFLKALAERKVNTLRTAIRSPNTVAFVERFVQTIKQECLDHFVVFGRRHMDVLCGEFEEHYHQERPHQGLDNQTIPLNAANAKRVKKPPAPSAIRLSDVHCKERLGGLLKSYSRKSAA